MHVIRHTVLALPDDTYTSGDFVMQQKTQPRRRARVLGLIAVLILTFVGGTMLVASPASAATLPAGTTVQSAQTGFDSTAEKTAEAKCPAGKRVLGGGVRVNAGDHVVVTREEPISSRSGDSYLVTADEDAVGTIATWSLQALAICSDPIPGLRIIAAVGPTGTESFAGISAECPTGTNAIGTGGRILDGQGRVDLVTEVNGGVLNPHGTFAAGMEGLTDFAGNWSAIAFAVCATARFGDVQLVQTFSATDNNNKILTAVCPSGTTVTGGTGWADAPGIVASTNVDASRARIQVIARQFDTSVISPWKAIAMAICVA
jgi:hypothetical protein